MIHERLKGSSQDRGLAYDQMTHQSKRDARVSERWVKQRGWKRRGQRSTSFGRRVSAAVSFSAHFSQVMKVGCVYIDDANAGVSRATHLAA